MNEQDPWSRVEELFHTAQQQPIAERDAWIDAQTQEPEAVRNEVKSLLAGLDIHEQRCQSNADEGLPEQEEPALPTARFGPYQTVKLIGRGGMGAVYVASRVDG